eukprot:4683017-Pleurochrysis_carterae.AAC.1
MLHRLRGVARVHRALGYQFGSLASVTEVCKGATQAYIDEHGYEALIPKRKEPLTNEMLVALVSTPHGAAIPGYPRLRA